MPAGHIERYIAELFIFITYTELRAAVGVSHPARRKIGARVKTVGIVPALNLRQQPRYHGVVNAKYSAAVKRNAVKMFFKSQLDILKSPVIIKMVVVYIGRHSYGRRELQKRTVGLVGFGHKKFSAPELGSALNIFKPAAYNHCRVQPAELQNQRCQGSGRGFTVSSGYRHRIFKPREFREHFHSGYHGYLAFKRAKHLGI